MSKKIKAKNKHLSQNLRGAVREDYQNYGMPRVRLARGVKGYRPEESAAFNKTTPNTYQARKEKYSKSKDKEKSSFLSRLFG